MAKIYPDIDPALIENSGEQRFYEAALELPPAYSVFYRYKFNLPGKEQGHDTLYEADFIIVHPYLGYLVVEVKEGQYQYFNNTWQKQLGYDYVTVEKDPVAQAERAMFDILNRYKKEAKRTNFPLKIAYAVCFPDCRHLTGVTPPHLKQESIWLADELEQLDKSIRALFGRQAEEPEEQAVKLLTEKVLAPHFKVFSDLEDQMAQFHLRSEKILTAEQERILDETELDRRKIYFGAAGTGKTFIAMEKVRRLAREGKKVLLTCFNRDLAHLLQQELTDVKSSCGLKVTNFHNLLVGLLEDKGIPFSVPGESGARAHFFTVDLPELAFELIATLGEEEKYDALVVDEGQDFREEWFIVLQGLLREGEQGDYYIFADPCQSIFNPAADYLKSFAVSKHRLTHNLRNTEAINKWLTELLPEAELKNEHRGGLPVGFFPWGDAEEELRMATRELGRLVSQRINPGRVVILSPHVLEKSAFAGRDKIGEWVLYNCGRDRGAKWQSEEGGGTAAEEKVKKKPPNAVIFSTIRAFKGLEADIVFLTGVKEGSQACTLNDIYVGCSRARFLLYVFHEAGYKFGGESK